MNVPFPSPDELKTQQRTVLEPDAQRLRDLVQAAFLKPSQTNEYWVDVTRAGFNQMVYKIVGEELAASGWHTRLDSSGINESSWIISPAK